jgi:hypothetical protein
LGKRAPFYKNPNNWIALLWLSFQTWLYWYSRTALSGVGLVCAITVLALTSFRISLAHVVAFIPLTVTLAFAFAFAYGFDVGDSYRKAMHFPYRITPTQGADLKVKIVRSGERGLLFYDDTNKLTLLPWSEIKKISSER